MERVLAIDLRMTLHGFLDHFRPEQTLEAHIPGGLIQQIPDSDNGIDVTLDLSDIPGAEGFVLVHGAEKALIPRTVPIHPQDQCLAFSDRTHGPTFYGVVFRVCSRQSLSLS
jgi:hypothetical protein